MAKDDRQVTIKGAAFADLEEIALEMVGGKTEIAPSPAKVIYQLIAEHKAQKVEA